MTWRDKITLTRLVLQKRPELGMVYSDAEIETPEEDMLELQKQYSFVSKEYLDFLRLYDGMQLDTCVLFGTGKTAFMSRKKAARRWENILDISKFLPIGEDASGCCFALNQLGEVWRFDHDPPDISTARRLSDGFSDFVESVLMGPKIVELFDGSWNNRKENEWSKHLKEHGWL